MLKNLWENLTYFLRGKPLVEPVARAPFKPKKTIWVFYKSKYGIDPEKDKTIREFLGEDKWFGSGSGFRERDNSFYWSPEIESRAAHLKNIGMINRIQIFDPEQQAA